LEAVEAMPSLSSLGGGRQQLLDLAGDGQLDLVELDGPTPGFYERTDEKSWSPFRPFDSLPVLDWSDRNQKFVDLTGDGHADILITDHEAFCWHPSLAEAGFGPPETVRKELDEERGPRLVFADGTESIYLADLSGDGLSDLVRIRNGSVCYWPNLGYGRFGAKVTMDNAPWFDSADWFDQRRIRLADIDGSGATDILYLNGDGVAIYYNQSGNSWSDARPLDMPRIDNLSAVQAIDLLGNGTACLVWSSPLPGDGRQPMRYIDLMGGHKPHLLIGSQNNLGAETRVQYAPSTKFYVQDRLDGNPWITRIPFVAHVVERIETFDHISRNRFVSRYAYHHGYFDGVEREFRGFGMVEQFDTEEFAALTGTDSLAPSGGEGRGEGVATSNIEERSHVPPVHTKTWFHTGLYLGRQRVSNFFAGLLDARDTGEYYREPGLTDEVAVRLLLPDTILPEGLTAEEEREACRALKGAMLRQEVYALDGSEKAPHPYSVTEQNFTIEMLQPEAGNRHAVFFIHAREALSYHYERTHDPADPRVSHALTLEVDAFGNVLQSAAIGYGRREPDPALAAEDQAKQAQLLITCAANRYTNAVEQDDAYRAPLAGESASFELTGLALDAGRACFTFDEIYSAVQAATPIAYHETPAAGALQKRLLARSRILYRRDDLAGALALGELQSLAVPFESYQLAFTPEHLAAIFGDRVDDGMLSGEGAYVHSEGEPSWWIPSGLVFFSPDEHDLPAAELAEARTHFFLPRRFRDPFGASATVQYDPYDLSVLETVDPLGNRVTAGERTEAGIEPSIDYRVLQPELLTDPNGNRTAVACDTLGLVTGTAVMGKRTENLGDSLEGFEADLTEAVTLEHLADPLSDPHAILGRATTRLVYDLFAYQRTQDLPALQPAAVYTLARETHDADLEPGQQTRVQHSFSYSDGFGREIQKKLQAEPGPVPRRDADGAILVGPDGQPEMTENDGSPRWVGSGWTVFNNKGKPVRQYEPFFTDTHRFEFDVRIGVSPVLFYDPVGRVVATLHPNHSWEKVLFDPWRQETWDVNDTVLVSDPKADPDVGDFFRRLPDADYLPTWHGLRADPAQAAEAAARWPDAEQRQPEASAAAKAAAHANTPVVAHFDSLGRAFLSIADNGPAGRYETRTEQDIEGATLRVIDARGNAVMVYQVNAEGPDGVVQPVIGYDVAGRQPFQHSMDGGDRRVLMDIAGNPIRAWDSRGHILRTRYDALRRPTHLFVQFQSGEEILAERTVYGEDHPQAESLNLRGRVYQHNDGAGVVTNERFDFKGNPLQGNRRLAREYRQTVDWSPISELADIAAVEAAATSLLESEVFATETRYDALNRPVSMLTPDGSVTLPGYNEANLLERMEVRLRGANTATPFVTGID
jgi:hypothetical protein